METDHKNKLIALAYLKNGGKPREIAEKLGLTYQAVLNYRKELEKAEKDNSVAELFSLEEAALQALIDAVEDELSPAVETLTGEIEPLQTSLTNISNQANSSKLLEEQLNTSATHLAKQIQAKAIVSSNPETLLMLAEALAKLQSSFFAKGNNVQVNNYGERFSEFLSD